jgi:hypothetical protein
MTTWYDSASLNGNTIYYDPTTSTPSYSLMSVVEMREIYLKLCPEGQYVTWDSFLGYYVCKSCDPLCKNCFDSTKNSCIDCNLPYKFLKQEYTCIIVAGCPVGYYEDPNTGLCEDCDPYCISCSGKANLCGMCKSTAFR